MIKNFEDYIDINPKVMLGKPIIKGTRITVELIMEKTAYGYDVNDILRAYPHLTREQILAAYAFALQSFQTDVFYSNTPKSLAA
jgi:uncharacterized protein (DUF433 family)